MKQSLYLVLLIFCSTAQSSEEPTCHIDPNSSVDVCLGQHNITIKVGDNQKKYTRVDFEIIIQQQIGAWLEKSNYPKDLLCSSEVEYWLSIPDSAPNSTQSRVVILNANKNFMFYVSPFPDDWEIGIEQLAILDKKTYPQSSGYSAAKILIKSKPKIQQKVLDYYMSQYEATHLESMSGLWNSYAIPPFSEAETSLSLKNDSAAQLLIEEIESNMFFEWISTKELAYNFSWDCTPPSP
jgi:hypothetical protein